MDSIADMLVRINNALRIREEAVEIPYSKMKEGIGRILQEEGYVARSEIVTRVSRKYLRINLKYNAAKRGVISSLEKVSTPGRRIYVGVDAIPKVHSGFGTAILSTPRGLLTDEKARAGKVGGEVICYVW